MRQARARRRHRGRRGDARERRRLVRFDRGGLRAGDAYQGGLGCAGWRLRRHLSRPRRIRVGAEDPDRRHRRRHAEGDPDAGHQPESMFEGNRNLPEALAHLDAPTMPALPRIRLALWLISCLNETSLRRQSAWERGRKREQRRDVSLAPFLEVRPTSRFSAQDPSAELR